MQEKTNWRVRSDESDKSLWSVGRRSSLGSWFQRQGDAWRKDIRSSELYLVIPSHWDWHAYSGLFDVCSGSACRQFHRATSTACSRPTSSQASPTHMYASSSAKVSTRTVPCELCTLPRTTSSWHATFSLSSVGVDRRPHVARRERHSTRARNLVLVHCWTRRHSLLFVRQISLKNSFCASKFFCVFSAYWLWCSVLSFT